MPWICNFSRFDLYSGYSFKKDKLFKYKSDCVLIQISAFDINTYPEGLSDWVREKNRHRFFFHDVKKLIMASIKLNLVNKTLIRFIPY